jgi:hydrogenase maturation protease
VNPAQALVVCIGNELVADDAVGYHVYQQLQQTGLPAGTRLEYCGVGGVALLELLLQGDQLLVVVDAVQLGSPVGTVHCFPWEDLPSMTDHAISAHGIGLKDTIAIGQTLYPERMPSKVVLIGVEGSCFDQLGADMTDKVAASIPTAIAAVHRVLNQDTAGGKHE